MNSDLFLPNEGINLVKYSGKEFVDKLGLEVVQNAVSSVLHGNNVRDLTEGLTQRRVLIIGASLIVTYLKGLSSNEKFEEQLTSIINDGIKHKNFSSDEKTYLLWYLGLTGKSIQNVVRDKSIESYSRVFDSNLKSIADDVERIYGDIKLDINYEDKNIIMRWPNLLRCLLAVGASTLTTRGSEKSMYGKTFEKLVMGSTLTILGFELIDRKDTSKKSKVFWLSDKKDDVREIDTTILIRPGVGVKFDIGFIGPGNTEISLDKVTRYGNTLKRDDSTYLVTTIILVDKIGERSKAPELAEDRQGTILQMSENYWVYKLAQILKEKCNYDSPITNMTKEASLDYIEQEMRKIDLRKFLNPVDNDSGEIKLEI